MRTFGRGSPASADGLGTWAVGEGTGEVFHVLGRGAGFATLAGVTAERSAELAREPERLRDALIALDPVAAARTTEGTASSMRPAA